MANFTSPDRSSVLTSLAVAGFFLLAGFLAIWMLLAPSPKSVTAPATEFSAVRALEHSKATARQIHPMGSVANDAVRAYILSKLKEMGVQTEEQISQRVEGHTLVETKNVIGRIPGTANTKAFTTMAHYDSVPYGPGAADDGAGVVTMLETARALKAGPPLKNDVIFLFTDGEEAGEQGAEMFLQSPWAEKVGLIVNLETRGTSGPSMMFETSPGNGWLIPEVAKADIYVRACSLMYDVYKRMPLNSDFSNAKRHGLKGFNIAFIDDFAWYHTKNDTPEHMSLASLQNHGSYALGLARHFGNLPLDGDLTAPDVVYFNTIGSHLVYYPMSWSGKVVSLAVIMFAAMLVLGLLRGHLTILGFIGGALSFMLVTALSMLITLVALAIVYGPQKLYTQYTTSITNLPDLVALNHNALYGWAFAALTVCVFMSCYQALVRRVLPSNLAAGALLWWMPVAVALQLFMPGGSYLAAWPLFFASLGLAISFLWSANAPVSPIRVAILGLFALPGLFLVTPSYQVLLSTIMVMNGPALALLMALILSLLIPHTPAMTTPNRWWLSVSAGVPALLMLAFGAATSGYTAERPRLNSIAYGLDMDSGSAYWMSYDRELDEWTSTFFPKNSLKPPRGTLTEFFTDDTREYWKASAPVAPLAGPQAAVVSDGMGQDGREITVHLAAPDKPIDYQLRLISDTRLRRAKAFGKTVEGGGKDWRMNFRAFPHAGVDIVFGIDPGTAMTLRLSTRNVGLPNLPGVSPRPDHMAIEPNTIRRSWSFRSDDVIVVKTVQIPASADTSAQTYPSHE